MANIKTKSAVGPAIGIVLMAVLVFAGIWIGENSNIFGETEGSMSETQDSMSDDNRLSDNRWGYEGDGGPENWGRLSGKYSQCSEGREQSPIDIDTSSVVSGTEREAPPLSFHYGDDEIHSVHTGLFVKIKYEAEESYIRLGNRAYDLIEIHPHMPGEHTVDGQSFPMEMHLVHRGVQSELAVVGILFRLGEANPAVQHFIDAVPIHPGDDYFPSEHFDAMDMLPSENSYYGYRGSLTTPPCTEGVRWLVMSEIQEVSQEQVDQLSALTGNIENSRPVQPLGDRSVAFSG